MGIGSLEVMHHATSMVACVSGTTYMLEEKVTTSSLSFGYKD